MKNLIYALLFIPLIACAAKEKDGKTVFVNNKNAVFVGTFATPDDLRRKEFFEKKTEVTYQKDKLAFNALLQLPEIEMALQKERDEQNKMESKPDNGVHAFNGHVCVQIGLKSGNTVDYSTTKWKADVKIDGTKAKSTTETRVRRLYDLGQGTANVIPGETDITICTASRFLKVKAVHVNLKDKKKSVVKFDWNEPWPALHEN